MKHQCVLLMVATTPQIQIQSERKL